MVTAPSGRISIHALGLNGSRATGACEPRGSNAGRYSPITRVAPAAAPVLRKSRRLTIAWLMSHLWSVRSGQPTTGVTTTSIVLVLSRSCQSLGTSLVRLRTARHVRPPQGTLRPPGREEYTRGHELNPRDAILLVKLGHANTFLGDYAAARADYDSAIAVGRANEKAAYAPFRAYVSVYAGDPAAAIDELNRLVAAVDGMGVPHPDTAKVAALTNVAVIATHTRNQAAAERALEQLGPLLMQQADEAGNAAYRRGQQATIAYYAGWWAARRGDYAAAQQQADQIGQLLAPDANPRKLEPMHQLEGFIALYQRKYREAARHLRLGNQLDPYIKYQLALATGGAGDAAEAKRLFSEVAEYNFNTVGFALVRKDAQQKAGAGTL